MNTIKATVRNRRIDVPAPSDYPDGTEVLLTIAPSDDNAPLPSEEIARVLAAMQTLEPLVIPDDVAADLVVTTDSDLSAIPGLPVENWALPLEASGE